ncbi:DUF6090 family protein [Robiginitalea sediminis]|uniref:DUF6090 family protein n=1 Tax=Robiginitalea sediminis TaxID=1982593 RepID=UPI000B4BD13C|nr:DUF6090 family protein [Robiginitalea sediminis]
MIQFFRTIRNQLLSQNNFRKYLFYAAGEIVLVVIGILIALQINNLNEARKDREKEQAILRQLRSEYQNNLEQLNQKIEMRNEGLMACNTLLEFIDEPESLEEAVFYSAMANISRDPTFDPIKNDIIGTDKIRLIQNDTLVRYLSNWSSEVYQVQELETDFKKYRTEMIFPSHVRLGIARNLNDNLWKDGYTPTEALDSTFSYKFTLKPTRKPLDLIAVLQDTALEGIISQVVTYHQITNIQSETLRDRIREMLELLDREIK